MIYVALVTALTVWLVIEAWLAVARAKKEKEKDL